MAMESNRGIVFVKFIAMHLRIESVIIFLTAKFYVFHFVSAALNVNFYAQCMQCSALVRQWVETWGVASSHYLTIKFLAPDSFTASNL